MTQHHADYAKRQRSSAISLGELRFGLLPEHGRERQKRGIQIFL
jgi:hypothetical protein